MKESLYILVIFLFTLSLASCIKIKSKVRVQNLIQSVESSDTVWVRSQGTRIIMHEPIKMIDISEYSITGKIISDTIFLMGGANNEKPEVAKLIILLKNESVVEFTVALNDKKGSMFATHQ